MGPRKLAQALKIEPELAKDYIKRFFSAYPDTKTWMHQVWSDCERDGIVYTWLGRPRRVPEIRSSVDWVKARAQRQVPNSIIQGSAADVTMRAMLKVENDPRLQELGCQLLLQVHDELVFEVPMQNAELALPIVKELMEVPRSDAMLVPLTVSAHIGRTWAEAK